nr:uncharacterized protein LOC122268303 [Parasteatoda tepidariorum]
MKKSKEEYTNPTAVSIEIPEMLSADELDKIFILTGSSNYSEVLKSYAFVDKTLHIRSIVQDKGPILFSGPFCCGKSTNINMINYFLAIEVDSEGNEVENVLKNADGKWVEKEIQTEKFQHFKNLNIYKCQLETKHTNDECSKGECLHRNFFYENCGQHPVIFISFKDVSYHSNKLEKSLNESIRKSRMC